MAQKDPRFIVYLRSATQAALAEQAGEYSRAVRFWGIAANWASGKNEIYVKKRIEFCERMVERPFLGEENEKICGENGMLG